MNNQNQQQNRLPHNLEMNKEILYSNLKKFFGFDTFKGNQEAVIYSILNKQDTFVLMPTGGGKSLCYQLPALMLEGTAIVISPLIALMKNQVDAMRNYGEEDGIAHFMNSSLTKSEIEKVKMDVTSGKTKLLYVAPESLTKLENIDFLRGVPISFYAVDEAHCISEWGHDFRPDYRRITNIIKTLPPNVPVIATTATANQRVVEDISSQLGDIEVSRGPLVRESLILQIIKLNDQAERMAWLVDNVPKMPGVGIIYCLTVSDCEDAPIAVEIEVAASGPVMA